MANYKYRKRKPPNIKKQFYKELKFDSMLELYFYKLLEKAKIEFKFQKTYILLEGFRYHGKAIRKMSLTVDFYISKLNILIDTKGFQRNDNKIKWKLLKDKLIKTENPPEIHMPRNKSQCAEMIKLLKEKENEKANLLF